MRTRQQGENVAAVNSKRFSAEQCRKSLSGTEQPSARQQRAPKWKREREIYMHMHWLIHCERLVPVEVNARSAETNGSSVLLHVRLGPSGESAEIVEVLCSIVVRVPESMTRRTREVAHHLAPLICGGINSHARRTDSLHSLRHGSLHPSVVESRTLLTPGLDIQPQGT